MASLQRVDTTIRPSTLFLTLAVITKTPCPELETYIIHGTWHILLLLPWVVTIPRE